jgi:hypothetical protein
MSSRLEESGMSSEIWGESSGQPAGIYSKEERQEKIQRYKNKIRKYREAHPVMRTFEGRSKIAGSKPRIKGRFAKKETKEELFGSKGTMETEPTSVENREGNQANQPAT